MKIDYNDLLSCVLGALESSLGVTEEGISGISEGLSLDFTDDFDGLDGNFDFDDGFYDGDCECGRSNVSVEVEFGDTAFASDYFRGQTISASFDFDGTTAAVRMFFGASCTDPAIANEFMDFYALNSRYAKLWKCDLSAESDAGLVLKSEFAAVDPMELEKGIAKRMALFANPRFTNWLRPFIHYFEH